MTYNHPYQSMYEHIVRIEKKNTSVTWHSAPRRRTEWISRIGLDCGADADDDDVASSLYDARRMFSAATTTRITLGATTSSVRSRKTTTASAAFGRPTQKPAGMRAALAPAAIELKAERRVAGVARRASVVTYVRRLR